MFGSSNGEMPWKTGFSKVRNVNLLEPNACCKQDMQCAEIDFVVECGKFFGQVGVVVGGYFEEKTMVFPRTKRISESSRKKIVLIKERSTVHPNTVRPPGLDCKYVTSACLL